MAKTERSGHTTTDHDFIRGWVEERGGWPARVGGTGGGEDPGILRIDFPGYSGGDSLERMEWEEWFEKFDENQLAFLHRDMSHGGKDLDRFNKLVSRGAEGGSSRSARSSSGSKSTGSRSSSKSSGSKSSGTTASKSAGKSSGTTASKSAGKSSGSKSGGGSRSTSSSKSSGSKSGGTTASKSAGKSSNTASKSAGKSAGKSSGSKSGGSRSTSSSKSSGTTARSTASKSAGKSAGKSSGGKSSNGGSASKAGGLLRSAVAVLRGGGSGDGDGAGEMRELLKHELGDLLFAEKVFLKGTKTLAKEAQDPTVKTRIEEHVRETEGQIERLNEAFRAIGERPKAEKCEAALGLQKEHDSFKSDEKPSKMLLAAFDLGSGLRVEHYEIAGYRSAIALATALGERECAALLKENLQEEVAMAAFLEKSSLAVLRAMAKA